VYILGVITQVNNYGVYWTLDIDGQNSKLLYYDSAVSLISGSERGNGASVRLIKEIGVSGFTGGTFNGLEYQLVTSITGRVWLDRNLGASQVATAFDDSDAYGDLYQWGRLTDGHEKRTSSVTLTLSTTDVPGHDDFIASSVSPYDWRSPQNDKLWQSVKAGSPGRSFVTNKEITKPTIRCS
jgi:hypothetical protein